MTNSWKPEKFSAKELEDGIKNKKIIVPKFQRGLTWSESQKETLIDSIKRGLPFGTILLYRDDSTGTDQIIDGLQRCSTIFEFMSNPAKYFSEADITDEVVANVFDCLGVAGNRQEIVRQIKECLLKWVADEHSSMQDIVKMQYHKFANYLSNSFPTAKESVSAIADIIEPTFDAYQDICSNLVGIEIPALVIKGDEEVLPEVFERINSQGTKLTKYQIYAATWLSDKYSIISCDHIDLVKANRERYDNMFGGMLELDDYDSQEFVLQKELTVFELAFGFGKVISNKYPALFEGKKSPTEVDSVGFTLFNACLGGKSNEMKGLNTRIRKLIPDDKALDLFLQKLFRCIDYVDKIIGKYNRFKGNGRETLERPLHTELQISSIIAYVFVNQYAAVSYNEKGNISDFQLNLTSQNTTWKNSETVFKRNISKIYIMEVLQQRWSSAGDKKLDSIVANLGYYTRTIIQEDFISVLQNWFETIKNERKEYKKIATPKEPEKLFLNLVYINEFSAKSQLDDSAFDIEHLATKNLMKKQLDRFEGALKLPISSIGNLCLLPQAENRSKGEKTIYSDKEYLKNSKLTIEEIEEQYSFTEHQDLEWIYDSSLTEEELTKAYLTFIERRFERMKERLITYYEAI